MSNTEKQTDSIPEEFDSYEEAAEFWDSHDTTDYPDAFETVVVTAELKKRRYDVPIDEDIINFLRKRASKLGTTVDHVANEILREQMVLGR